MGEYRDVRVGGLITSLRETRTDDLANQLAEAQAEVERLSDLLESYRQGVQLDPTAIERLRADGERLRAALIEAERQIHMNRIWGGMAWRYHAMLPKRVEKLAKLIREALDAARATTKERKRDEA